MISEIQRWLYQGMAVGMGEAHSSGISATLVMLAFAFGGLHALMPGHGKSVLVSYHLGSATNALKALINGSLLVIAHVGTAIALVLAGLAVIRLSFGPSPQIRYMELSSAAFIVVIGAWMLWRAFHPHRHGALSGPTLAFVTGLVPCPLTTFIMSFSVVNGLVGVGLLVVGTMALGMIATIAGFAVMAVLVRKSFLEFLSRSESWRTRIARLLELLGAIGVVALGGSLLYRNL